MIFTFTKLCIILAFIRMEKEDRNKFISEIHTYSIELHIQCYSSSERVHVSTYSSCTVRQCDVIITCYNLLCNCSYYIMFDEKRSVKFFFSTFKMLPSKFLNNLFSFS